MANSALSTTKNQGVDDSLDGDDASQIVSFRLANEEYGVDIMNVQEIILIGQITEMPQVPTFVRGLINLRGNVIPVIDLRVRFSLETSDQTESSRIVVLNVGERTMGVMVDAVDEVLRIRDEQIEPAPPGMAGLGRQYVRGLVKLESRLLVLLDIETVMDVDALSTRKETVALQPA